MSGIEGWMISPVDIDIGKIIQKKVSNLTILSKEDKSVEPCMRGCILYDYENKDFKIETSYKSRKYADKVLEDIFDGKDFLIALCLMYNTHSSNNAYTIEHDESLYEFHLKHHGIVNPNSVPTTDEYRFRSEEGSL
jgi:hypothetical protein